MRIYYILIVGLWLLLWVYWLISATRTKRTRTRTRSWRFEIGLRLVMLALILLLARLSSADRAGLAARLLALNRSVPLGVLGVALCALGIGLAIWSRACLGRNWGTPMTTKENQALVTTGPYARLRHPIYAGWLLAMLGSAIGQSPIWLIPLLGAAIYFSYSAQREERLMLEQFGDEYRTYMQRTRRFIPFIW
jgi:protein-S-isoprenylcysteine O-methyltransferase Ste14